MASISIDQITNMILSAYNKLSDYDPKGYESAKITPIMFMIMMNKNNDELYSSIIMNYITTHENEMKELDSQKRTVLMYACIYDNEIIAKKALEYNNINDKNKFGITALRYACTENSIKVVKLLLESDTNIFESSIEWCKCDLVRDLLNNYNNNKIKRLEDKKLV